MAHHIARKFDATAKDCPGSDECRTWQNFRKCADCPRGERPPRKVERQLERDACETVERLTTERRCGRVVDVDALDPLTWELMVAYEQIGQGYRDARAAQVTEAALYLKGFLKSFAEKK